MKDLLKKSILIFLLLPMLLLSFSELAECAPSALSSFASQTHHGVIDWVDFIRFGGITYVVAPTKPGRMLTANDLGPVFATVRLKLDGNVQDPAYQSKDGDAAFLDAGTKIYTMKGYRPTFRLAA